MINNFLKQTGQSAQDMAKKMAQQIKQEPGELLRNVKDQVVQNESKQQQPEGPSMMQEVMTADGKFIPPTEIEEQNIHAQTKNRLAQIEAELRQLRMQREQKSAEWVKEQDRVMSSGQDQQKHEFVAPPSKKQHGSRPGHKKSSDNSMETSRQKKG